MIAQVKNQEIIILFDEHGTPTFRTDRESEYFIGLGVAYNIKDEDQIFEECKVLFGLTNKQPLKNSKIRISRANKIAELIGKLPIQYLCMTINLSDEEFQTTINTYEKFGDLIREIHREVGGRPISQILHSRLLGSCLSELLINYVENENTDCTFKIYIDNWEIMRDDIYIELEFQCISLKKMLNSLFPEKSFSVMSIKLLDKDGFKKRFIDIITSIFSRFFLDIGNPKYSELLVSNIKSLERCNILNINLEMKRMLRKTMDEGSRVPPPIK